MRCEFEDKASHDWKRQELERFLQQLSMDTGNIDVLMNVGILYSELQEDSVAFYYLWQAYDIQKENNPQGPGHLGITMALADLHNRREEFVEAKHKYWEAMQIDWSHQKAHDGLNSAKIGLEANPPRRKYKEKPEPVSQEVIELVSISLSDPRP